MNEAKNIVRLIDKLDEQNDKVISALDNCIKVAKENAMMFKISAEKMKKELDAEKL